MAQSAITVTPPNPTPPTNFANTGATPPNPPNYTKLTYLNYVGVGLVGAAPSYANPPPFYDDGAAGTPTLFAANVAALASGTGATSGGTENTYPGAAGGAVPASSSVAHEGAGTESVSTINYPIVGTTYQNTLVTVGVGPVQTAATIAAGPNASHPSTLSPTTNPALVSISPTSTVSGAGTQLLTCTGTGFVPGCRIWVNNQEQVTTYVSATSLTATVNKKAQAGTWPVNVKLGGQNMGVTSTWTFT
jgi:hypothetical protein